MPELAEAETIRRQLIPLLTDKVITSVALGTERIHRRPEDPDEFTHELLGRRINRLLRRGKGIILILDESISLVIRLGMSGTLKLVDPSEPIDRHVHLRLGIAETGEIRLRDPRRFGGMSIHEGTDPDTFSEFAHYGPEALSDEFITTYLIDRLKNRKPLLGAILMDQRLVAGIGKIYSDEICFRAGIRPTRPAGKVTRKEAARLVQATKDVLAEAIGDRGTTAGDRTYRDAYGLPGGFRPAVYFRTGQPCASCGTPIRRMNLPGGRGLHWCPTCQK